MFHLPMLPILELISLLTTYNSFTILFCLRMAIKRGSQGLNRMGRLSPRQPPVNY